jgi:hypothetical protein
MLADENPPYAELGENGDIYLDIREDHYELYRKENDDWTLIGALSGPEGPEGPQGPQGNQGPAGANGTNGQNGQDGQPGADGKSAYELFCEHHPEWEGTEAEWLESLNGTDGQNGAPGQNGAKGDAGISMFTGHGAPTPDIGNNEDSWFDVDTGDLYKKSMSGWEKLAYNFRGPTGATGATGATGPAGADGNDGISPRIGANGHWFIGDTDTGVEARGPQGVQGSQGPQGLTGAKGNKGDIGEKGADGKDGTSLTTGQGTPLSGTGSAGDSYLDTRNGDIYTKSLAGWTKTGSISVAPVVWTGGAENQVLFSSFEPGYQSIDQLSQFKALIITLWEKDANPQRAFSITVSTSFLLSTVRAIHVPVSAHIIEPGNNDRLIVGDMEVFLLAGDNGLGINYYQAYLVPGDPATSYYYKPGSGRVATWIQEIVGVK